MDSQFVRELGTLVTEETKLGTNMKRIDKDSFMENLAQLVTRIMRYIDCVEMFSTDQRASLATRIYKNANNMNIACSTYVLIAKQLASKDEQWAFESSLYTARQLIIGLRGLERQVNTLFDRKTLTVYNARLTHLVAFGLLSEAEYFIGYATCLFDGITGELTTHQGIRELPQPLNYRTKKLTNGYDQFISICRARLANTTALMTKTIVDSGRNTLDVELVGSDNLINSRVSEFDNMPDAVKKIVTLGVRKRFIFRWLGEQWNVLRHVKHLKVVREHEWLQAHVGILQLELGNVDPDSAAYRKHVKVIEAYNGMLAELDAKIDKYMGE